MKPRKIMQTENNSLLELNGKVVAMHAMKVDGGTKAQLHSFLT
jgi:hypothetical protein